MAFSLCTFVIPRVCCCRKRSTTTVLLGETSELTTLFNQLWTDFDTNVLKGYPTVFVRLEKDSAGAKQFSEFCKE